MREKAERERKEAAERIGEEREKAARKKAAREKAERERKEAEEMAARKKAEREQREKAAREKAAREKAERERKEAERKRIEEAKRKRVEEAQRKRVEEAGKNVDQVLSNVDKCETGTDVPDHELIFKSLEQIVQDSKQSDYPLDQDTPVVVRARAFYNHYQRNRKVCLADNDIVEEYIKPIFDAALKCVNSAERISLARGKGIQELIKILFPGRDGYDVKVLAKRADSRNDGSKSLDMEEFRAFLWFTCEPKFVFSHPEKSCIRKEYLKPLLERIEKWLGIVESKTAGIADVIKGFGYSLVSANKLPVAEAVSKLEECRLGEGSFGDVYAVQHRRDKVVYAVKVLNLEGKTDKQKERIDKECATLAKLEHKNIVQYKHTFDKNPNIFIVLEYCSGGDLAGVISRGETLQLANDRIKNYVLQIARGLHYLHATKRVLHRDLKSDNIMVQSKSGGDRVLKISDLGLAVEGIASQVNLKTSVAKTAAKTRGSVVYRAPEKTPHHGSFDMWALGLMLAEIVVGKFVQNYGNFMNGDVFPAAKDPELIQALLNEVAQKNDETLTKVANGLLSKDETKRLTASQVIELLDPQTTLDRIGRKVDVIDKKIDTLGERLSGMLKAMVNLNLDPDLKFVPRYVLLVPGKYSTDNDGVFGFFSNIANRAYEWTGIQETYHLYILDEGPKLLGLKTSAKKPMHDPLQIKIPGELMRKAAPLLRFMSALLVVAKLAASASPTGLGNVIPDGLPFVEDLKRTAEEWDNLAEVLGDGFNLDVEGVADDAVAGAETKEEVTTNFERKAKRVMGASYRVIKGLLLDNKKEPPKNKKEETLDHLLRETVVRVIHPKRGSIHWVAQRHLEKLKKKAFVCADSAGSGGSAIGSTTAAGAHSGGVGGRTVGPLPSRCCAII